MIIAQTLLREYLDDGEKIRHVAHRHPIIHIAECVSVLFFGFAIPIFLWQVTTSLEIVLGIWMGIGYIYFMLVCMKWYYDCWVITDSSVIDVKWQSFWERKVSRIEYDWIGGISMKQPNFKSVLFRYADLEIDKGGSESVKLESVMAPRKVEKLIVSIRDHTVDTKKKQDEDAIKDLLYSLVKRHISENDNSKH